MGHLILHNNYKSLQNGSLSYSSNTVTLTPSFPLTQKSGSTLASVTFTVSSALSGIEFFATIYCKKFVSYALGASTTSLFNLVSLGTTESEPNADAYNPSESYLGADYIQYTSSGSGDGDILITLKNTTSSTISFNNMYIWGFCTSDSHTLTSDTKVLLMTYRFDETQTLAPAEQFTLRFYCA